MTRISEFLPRLLWMAALVIAQTAMVSAASWIDFEDLDTCGSIAVSQVYKKTAEGDLVADINLPPDAAPSDKRPALVFVHGGGWTAGSNRNHREHSRYFAARGMVVFNLSYRLVPTSGTGVDLFAQASDIRSAIRWIRQHAAEFGVDAERIAIAGESSGGHLAACAAFIDAFDDPADDRAVRATADLAILINPITDLPRIPWYAGSSARVGPLPLPIEDTPVNDPLDPGIHPARRISPLFHAAKPGHPPALFIHGDADSVVPFEQSQSLHRALLAAGHTSELLTLRGSHHAFFIPGYGSKSDTVRSMRAIDDFLRRHGYTVGPPVLAPFDLNLLENPGFEDGTVGWAGIGAISVEKDGSVPGSKSILSTASDAPASLRQAVATTILPAELADSGLVTVALQGSLRVADSADAGAAEAAVRFLDQDGEVMGGFMLGWTRIEANSWTTASRDQLLPLGTRSIELTIRTRRAVALDFDELSLTLSSTARATTYAAWQSSYFSAEEIADPLIGGPDAILPGSTTLTNFAKYAFRLPRQGGANAVTTEPIRLNSGLALRFPLDPGKTDVDYRVNFSDNLASWSVDASTSEISVVPDAFVIATVPDLRSVPEGAPRFGRVTVRMKESER